MLTVQAAKTYLERGWAPIPIPHGSKAPVVEEWQRLRLSTGELCAYFQDGQNVGLLLGEPGKGLVDVDLDCPEAIRVTSDFLPATQMIHGRTSRPASHFWYFAEPIPRTSKFADVKGTSLVELRSTGLQTLVPPSIHPSGEQLRWERNGEPARVSGSQLQRAVACVATCALLARHWPQKGSRHEVALALSGFLLRAGWEPERVQRLVMAAARAAGDEEWRARGADVASTEKRLAEDRSATGIPRLIDLVGKEVVDRICGWLQIRTPPATETFQVQASKPPEPLAQEAFHGLAGKVVRTIEPHTEADPAGLLIQFLTAFGNVIGRGPHFVAEADLHATVLFAVLVGATSKGRKGSSWSQIRRFFRAADPHWESEQLQSGLSSGEGLIWAVRDPITHRQAVENEEGEVVDYKIVLDDPGVEDKRLLVLESEFASPFKMMAREGNTLSVVIRQAWDRGDLRTLTKNSPAKATGAHISIIGHITKDELLRHLSTTEAANGFANRFLWIFVRRSKVLPEGGAVRDDDLLPLIDRLRGALEFARQVGEMKKDDEARAIWWEVYPELSDGKPGLLGAVISRAEAQVMRLACVYALLDCSAVIRKEHVLAALAVWEYAEASAGYIFGDSLGDPVADEIMRTLRNSPDGLTRTQIRDLFQRNRAAAEISRALGVLLENGLAEPRIEKTDGRPGERWFAVRRSTTKTTETPD